MTETRLQPAARVAGRGAYAVPRPPTPIDLILDGNEGPVPSASLFDAAALRGPELLRRYPSARGLESALARSFGLDVERVFVTAGADDALDRMARALLEPGRSLVLAWPSFVMIPHYVALAGARTIEVPWTAGPYPRAAVLGAIEEDTRVVALVSPNNPTGLAATAEDLTSLARANPGRLVVLDHAYAEFADEDLTACALAEPNVLVLRTFSKACGLAGLRVGFALGPPDVLAWMRAAGSPYPLSAVSLAMAEAALALAPNGAYLERIRHERRELVELLRDLGSEAPASQANFVWARFDDAAFVRAGLAGLGIGVRGFPDQPLGSDRLRITCPGSPEPFARLRAALHTVSRPERVVVDLREDPGGDLGGRALRPERPGAVSPLLASLPVQGTWWITDRPASLAQARTFGALPLAFAPGADGARRHDLLAAGAGLVFEDWNRLLEKLP